MKIPALLAIACAAGLLLSGCSTPGAGEGPPVHASPGIAVAEMGLATLMVDLTDAIEDEYGADLVTDLPSYSTEPRGGRDVCWWTEPTWRSSIQQVYPEEVPGYSSYRQSKRYLWPVAASPTPDQLLALADSIITRAGYTRWAIPPPDPATGLAVSEYANANGDGVYVRFSAMPGAVRNSLEVGVALSGCYPDR